MSAALALQTPQSAAPESATPPDPNWRWYNALDGADPQKQPRKPTLLAAGLFITFDTLQDLAVAIARRLDGKAAVLAKSVVTYHGYDSFPAFSVYAAPRQPGDGAVAYAACQDVKEPTRDALAAAIGAAQQIAGAAV